MRPRFLALIQRDLDRTPDRLANLGLQLRGQANAMTLFADQESPLVRLGTVGGWIIGRLFRRTDNSFVRHFDADEQTLLSISRGQHLIDHFWGSYVAVWHAADGGCHVLRDPSATMPVYAVERPTVSVASDLDLLMAVGAVRPAIDWLTLGHGLRFPLLPTAKTCIDGLTELLPGVVMHLGGHADTRLLWHPASFLQTSSASCASDGRCTELAQVIDSVVSAWSSCFSTTLLELSGGLDSSVLAAALARSGAHWSAATVATPSLEGDERRYAQIVASHCVAALQDYDLDVAAVHPLETSERMTVRPTGVRLLQGLDRIFRSAASDARAEASFSGTGGDNIFGYLRSTAPVLDAVAAGGAVLAWRALDNLIKFSGVTAWEATASLARRWWRERHATSSGRPDDMLLARDAISPYRGHPWIETARPMASGQRAHIRSLIGAHPIISGHPRTSLSTMIFPLLSQPVMEAALAIPAWQWLSGGRDREPVRRAFAQRLPASILARRQKGHFASVVTAAFARDREEIREVLLDGRLVGAGLVDRGAVAQAFATPNPADAVLQNRLLDLADAELWVREIESIGVSPTLGH